MKSRSLKYQKCDYSGTLLLWTSWGPGEVYCIERCPFRKAYLGYSSVLNTEVSLFQGCPLGGVPLYSGMMNSLGKQFIRRRSS